MLFEETYTEGARDPENFINPEISSVNVNIDGIPNKLYSKGIKHSDFWTEIKKPFHNRLYNVDESKFYTVSRYGLWIDLRTFPDNNLHGTGMRILSTRDGIKLEI